MNRDAVTPCHLSQAVLSTRVLNTAGVSINFTVRIGQ